MNKPNEKAGDEDRTCVKCGGHVETGKGYRYHSEADAWLHHKSECLRFLVREMAELRGRLEKQEARADEIEEAVKTVGYPHDPFC